MAIQTLTYSMNGTRLLAAINANISDIENMATGDSDTVLGSVSTYQDFVSSVNTAIDDINKSSTGRAKAHTDIVTTAGALISGMNTNFGIVNGQAELFQAEVPPFFPKLKQLYIGSDYARIVCQQDDWKLAMIWGSDILYLSADGGATWPYSKQIAFTAANLRMAWVFKDGSVIVAGKEDDNKIYSSQDLLTTVNEITVPGLVRHVPVNAALPGLYFGALMTESYMVDGVEVLAWGAYWQGQDDVGATPINIYYTADGGATIKIMYKFGDNPAERDDGTSYAGAGGNIIGDVTNPIYCHHFHYTAFNSYNETFYFCTGDHGVECGILEGHYNTVTDVWTLTWHAMTDAGNFFRVAGMRFPDASTVIWTNDAGDGGGIYQCSLANIFSTDHGDHTALFLSGGSVNEDMIGLSEYGEHMISTRFTDSPSIVGSNDYGVTWQNIPDEYFQHLPVHPVFLSVQKPFKIDSDGYMLVHNSSLANQCAQYCFLMKLMNKPT